MASELLEEFALDALRQTPVGKGLQKALETFREIQEDICILDGRKDEKFLNALKAGTILIFAMVKRLGVKNPKDYSKDDWASVAKEVSDYAVKMDDQEYSEFVFLLYARYINNWTDMLSKVISPAAQKELRGLSAELEAKTESLHNAEITETAYIDECLWVCLEAMLKLLVSTAAMVTGEDASKFARALSDFAINYGRLALYQKEQVVLEGYIEHQNELDELIATQYAEYTEELEAKKAEFLNLVDCAFDSNIRERLKGSIELARSAGVAEEEILSNVRQIDDFFM